MPASPMHTETEIDVIVVNYRTPMHTQAALQAVAGPLTRIYVTDNSGDLPERVAAMAKVWSPGRNTLFAEGNNHWYEQTVSPWVLLLNPDVVLPYAGLLQLRHELAQRPDCWGVAPRLIGTDCIDQNYLRSFPSALALVAQIFPPVRPMARRATDRYLCVGADLRTPRIVEQPPAACLLLRRDAVGPSLFHRDLRLFFNDAYLAWRLNQGGHCWYAPHITATHEQRASIRRAEPIDILAEYAADMRRFARLTRLRGRWFVAGVASLRLMEVAVVRRHRR